jgi:hypothetical protein
MLSPVVILTSGEMKTGWGRPYKMVGFNGMLARSLQAVLDLNLCED